MYKIQELLTSENANIVAKELMEAFVDKASTENVDYNFTIAKEKGSITDNNSNTFFYFDTDENTVLEEIKLALYSEDLSHIEEGSQEEIDLMEEVHMFFKKTCDISINLYKKDWQDTIRKVVLGGKSEADAIPLDTIEILSVDVADYSSVPEPSKHLLKIGRVPEKEIDTDEITLFLYDKMEETGLPVETIFEQEKIKGNNLFANVIVVEQGRRYLNEISLYMFVDFSLSQKMQDFLVENSNKEE